MILVLIKYWCKQQITFRRQKLITVLDYIKIKNLIMEDMLECSDDNTV